MKMMDILIYSYFLIRIVFCNLPFAIQNDDFLAKTIAYNIKLDQPLPLPLDLLESVYALDRLLVYGIVTLYN